MKSQVLHIFYKLLETSALRVANVKASEEPKVERRGSVGSEGILNAHLVLMSSCWAGGHCQLLQDCARGFPFSWERNHFKNHTSLSSYLVSIKYTGWWLWIYNHDINLCPGQILFPSLQHSHKPRKQESTGRLCCREALMGRKELPGEGWQGFQPPRDPAGYLPLCWLAGSTLSIGSPLFPNPKAFVTLRQTALLFSPIYLLLLTAILLGSGWDEPL